MVYVEPHSPSEFDAAFNGAKKCIVFYTAIWSSPCRQMELLAEEHSKKTQGITFIKVDIDQLNSLDRIKTIKSIPTFKSYFNKNEIFQFIGPAPGFLDKMVSDLNSK